MKNYPSYIKNKHGYFLRTKDTSMKLKIMIKWLVWIGKIKLNWCLQRGAKKKNKTPRIINVSEKKLPKSTNIHAEKSG